jgi:hypothetical protein
VEKHNYRELTSIYRHRLDATPSAPHLQVHHIEYNTKTASCCSGGAQCCWRPDQNLRLPVQEPGTAHQSGGEALHLFPSTRGWPRFMRLTGVRILTHAEYSGRLLAPLHNTVPIPAPASFEHPFVTTLLAPATRLRRDTITNPSSMPVGFCYAAIQPLDQFTTVNSHVYRKRLDIST